MLAPDNTNRIAPRSTRYLGRISGSGRRRDGRECINTRAHAPPRATRENMQQRNAHLCRKRRVGMNGPLRHWKKMNSFC
eukprot:7156612-Prymnesium_polylepis.1